MFELSLSLLLFLGLVISLLNFFLWKKISDKTEHSFFYSWFVEARIKSFLQVILFIVVIIFFSVVTLMYPVDVSCYSVEAVSGEREC